MQQNKRSAHASMSKYQLKRLLIIDLRQNTHIHKILPIMPKTINIKLIIMSMGSIGVVFKGKLSFRVSLEFKSLI